MEAFVRDAAVIVFSPVLIWMSAISSLLVRRLYLRDMQEGEEPLFPAIGRIVLCKQVLIPIYVLGLLLSFLFTHYMLSKILAAVIFGAGLHSVFSKHSRP